MSLEQNNWQPTAELETLRQRALILNKIREFFRERKVLEVETPILGSYGITDPFIQPIIATQGEQLFYLQTSPEYFMKRLLAAGFPDIFQISKCFRDDEVSRIHQPEFTLLEWYRLDFDQHRLMDEVALLLQLILGTAAIPRYTYQEIFLHYVSLDPLTATLENLVKAAADLNCPDLGTDRDGWLQILFTEKIERNLKDATFVYNFPASQAALARLSNTDPRVGARFELYANGIELANGFHELCDPVLQKQRFEKDNEIRTAFNLPNREIDANFMDALEAGLPDCAGVALGIDRLLMLALDKTKIDDVLSFA